MTYNDICWNVKAVLIDFIVSCFWPSGAVKQAVNKTQAFYHHVQ